MAGFSILAGLAILGGKYWAYRISGSAALMSDAIEGVVNVVAAIFALGAVLFSERPPDREHPYGHGKIEHFSAAFEGGLISLAAALILWEAIDTLIHGSQIRNLGMGILVNVGAGALNGLLGLFLVRMGRRHRSRAIEADGHHVLSDFWTTVGLALGLLIVRFTGLHWVDPLLAIGVSVLLASTGFRLVRTSSQALLDQEDPELLARLVEVLNRIPPTRSHRDPRAEDDAGRTNGVRGCARGGAGVLRHSPRPRRGRVGREVGAGRDGSRGSGAHPHRPLRTCLVPFVQAGRLPGPGRAVRASPNLSPWRTPSCPGSI